VRLEENPIFKWGEIDTKKFLTLLRLRVSDDFHFSYFKPELRENFLNLFQLHKNVIKEGGLWVCGDES
jgi:hypothetical protein